jgi:hypothetical protein
MTAKLSTKGFSLVELMISMSLGLFVLFGLFQLLVSTNKNYLLAQSLSYTQESGRIGLHFLTHAIHMAGFNVSGISRSVTIVQCDGALGAVCSKNDHNQSDRLALQLESPSNEYRDCVGKRHLKGVLLANVFWVENGDLVCRVWSSDQRKWFSYRQSLVSGIDALHVSYGIGPQKIERYMSDVPQSADKIWGIKISLLASAEGKLLRDHLREYVLLDANPMTFNDARYRQIYSASAAVSSVEMIGDGL